MTSERNESERVAEPARSLATETLSCSSARRTLASRTRSSWAAAKRIQELVGGGQGLLEAGVNQGGGRGVLAGTSRPHFGPTAESR